MKVEFGEQPHQGFPRLFAFDDFVLAAVQEFDPRAGLDPEYVPPPTRIWIGTLP